MSDHDDLERDLRLIESSLRKLESQYQMFFSGQLPKPPLETRGRVELLLRRYDRAYIQSYADRFRLSTLQTRFVRFCELWDRGLRAREEGRPGPFQVPRRHSNPPAEPAQAEHAGHADTGDVGAPPALPPTETVVKVPLGDPASEEEKLSVLYRSFVEARRAVGNEESLPFDSFAQLVKGQLSSLRRAGSRAVSFRIAVKDGKVSFTAKGLKEQEALE